jgi:hypothetical protein
MPSAPAPAPALRDRAERHVFTLLPELPAIERRVLALLELAAADRAATMADTGLDDTALRFAAKRARKALRRGSAPLAAGARCERAELLLSDRLDSPLKRPDRKWLEIHLARCPRCEEHEALLGAARSDLRTSFVAQPPPALPPAPTPLVLPSAERLRIVPAPAPEPAETPEPQALDDVHRPTADERQPPVAANEEPRPEPTPAPGPLTPSLPIPPPAVRDVRRPPADKRQASARDRRRGPSPAMKQAAKVVALLLVLAGLVAAAIAGIGAIDGDGAPQRAPWDAPGAPDVRPAPLSDQ